MKRATPEQLRSFGLTVGGVFAGIGLWPLVVHRIEPRFWALGLAAVLIVPALLYPRILWPAFRGWMAIGHILGWINTRIILGAIFYLLLTPMGLVRRWLGKGDISRDYDPGAGTYRILKPPRPASHMKYQY
jgi:hypothetical protein